MWGSDDNAAKAYYEDKEEYALLRFTEWVKEQVNKGGSYPIEKDKDGLIYGSIEIEGVGYKWYQLEKRRNGWQTWKLYTNDQEASVFHDGNYHYIGPNVNYKNKMVTFDTWDSMFNTLYVHEEAK